MPDSIRGNGDETQAIMEAIADIIAAFRGSSEWFAEWNLACSIWVPGPLTLQVTQKIQENRKNPLKMWYTNRQYRKKAEYGRIFYGRSKI